MKTILRIGTRRSPLALWQAEHVKTRLEASHPNLDCQLVYIITKGDKILDVPLARIGGKGLFIKEIEDALLRREIDCAVHSLKDMPSELPSGLVLGATPPREDPRDVLLTRDTSVSLDTAPMGTRIGTSSLRRIAQLRRYRNDLDLIPMRGNVGTRIKKMDTGDVDALVLACAGIKRIGETRRISQFLNPEICLPAIGQGVLGIEVREDDKKIQELLQPLNDTSTAFTVTAERAFLAHLHGGCLVPIGGLGIVSDGMLTLTGLVASLDGTECIRKYIRGIPESAEDLGRALADQILKAGGERILNDVYGKAEG
jgi:hydroxymethylbilane synthase